jgi:hypothetical protein
MLCGISSGDTIGALDDIVQISNPAATRFFLVLVRIL